MATNKFKSLLFALTVLLVLRSRLFKHIQFAELFESLITNGKISCANCPQIKKQLKLKHTICSSGFESKIKVPYDVSKQQIGANGKKLT
jgi:hypothetical protein